MVLKCEDIYLQLSAFKLLIFDQRWIGWRKLSYNEGEIKKNVVAKYENGDFHLILLPARISESLLWHMRNGPLGEDGGKHKTRFKIGP